MKILGNRLLVSKVEEPEVEGFKTVDTQDSFIFKGKVEQLGSGIPNLCLNKTDGSLTEYLSPQIDEIVLFAKYSPDTQEIDHEGKKMKIISVDDVLSIL